MRLKLLVILLILGIHVSEGGMILKKLTKELKNVIDGAKFKDFISMISDDVAENSDNIAENSDNIDSAIVSLSEDVAKEVNDLKVDVANNNASISSIDSTIVSLSEDVANNLTNLKTDVAVNAANIKKNKIDIANYHPVDFDSFLVTTGYPTSFATKTSEVIQNSTIDDSNGLTCKDLEEYPLQIYGAVGFNMASFNGFNGENMDSLPVICGGKRTGNKNPTKCYQMQSGKWNFFAHLTHGRYHAAGISHGQSFYIFGGINDGILKSTEIITDQGVSAPGPEMKVKVYLHAIARFNETTSIITGGLEDSLSVHQINKTSTNEPTRNTWYFSHVSEEFQRGLDLANRRYGHASSTIQDRKTKENIVAVVGGNVNDAETDTTELLVYEESIWKWKAGPKMTKPLVGSTAVQIGGDLYIVGGESSGVSETAIYMMSCLSHECTWTLMTQKLKVARRFSVSIPIPSKSFCSPRCTDNAQCTAKGDTGAKCTNDVIINGTKQPGTCSCTVAGYSTPDCSG